MSPLPPNVKGVPSINHLVLVPHGNKKPQKACFKKTLSNYLSLLKQPGHNSQLFPTSRTGYKLPNVLILEELIGRLYTKYSCSKDTKINRFRSGFALILVQLKHKPQ